MRSVNRVVKRCSSWVSSCSSMTTSCGKASSDRSAHHDRVQVQRRCRPRGVTMKYGPIACIVITPMSLVRGMPTLALVAAVACASHAKQLAKGTTMGVKAKLAQIDPAVARTLGDQAARGAVTGALAELANEQHRERVGAIVDTAWEAAARGVVSALSPDGERLQQLI